MPHVEVVGSSSPDARTQAEPSRAIGYEVCGNSDLMAGGGIATARSQDIGEQRHGQSPGPRILETSTEPLHRATLGVRNGLLAQPDSSNENEISTEKVLLHVNGENRKQKRAAACGERLPQYQVRE